MFNSIFTKAMSNDLWREWSVGEEHTYQVEQCLYGFFMNGLSVLESFRFCLYFLGAMIDEQNFQKTNSPKCITLKTTRTAFQAAFQNSSVTRNLTAMPNDSGFTRISDIRNLLAHRIAGRRNIRSVGASCSDGTYTEKREEFWHIPGLNENVIFDKHLVQRHLDDVTRLLTALTLASLEFVKSQQESP